jgi:NMD protein affecting ribosome stability and mRNA decay
MSIYNLIPGLREAERASLIEPEQKNVCESCFLEADDFYEIKKWGRPMEVCEHCFDKHVDALERDREEGLA